MENLKLKENELVEVNQELEKINGRVNNIEQIASTIETLAEHGLESWDKYLTQKDEQEKRNAELAQIQHQRELELEDKIHKRSIVILGIFVSFIFLLILVALLKEQNELVKIILTSSFAVAGGAGLVSLFKKNKNS